SAAQRIRYPALAAVLDDAQKRILRLELVEHLRRPVRGAVVDHDDFVRLGARTERVVAQLDEQRKILGLVLGRHQDRYGSPCGRRCGMQALDAHTRFLILAESTPSCSRYLRPCAARSERRPAREAPRWPGPSGGSWGLRRSRAWKSYP